MDTTDSIFNELKNGTTVTPEHPQVTELRDASYATIRLIQQLNASANPKEIKNILSEITGTAIDESVPATERPGSNKPSSAVGDYLGPRRLDQE